MTKESNNYLFEIFEQPRRNASDSKYYYYRIYKNGIFCLESDGNMFEALQEAKFAASGHIVLLKSGDK